jgi:TatD DNase family protein
MFDTHCHLNFSRFKKNVKEVVENAARAGIVHILVPGTDLSTSQRAVKIAHDFENIYAAVGIHPHHAVEFSYQLLGIRYQEEMKQIETLLQDEKVVAIGEVGLDRHVYTNTKYENNVINKDVMRVQKDLLIEQLRLAKKYNKSVILHNREAKRDILDVLTNNYSLITDNSLVFHCCEADQELLSFAQEHNIFIGVDGDVTYDVKKQNFVKLVPLDLLVLETDSPYLLPEPFRSKRMFPNEPKNIPLIAQCISELKKTSIKHLIKVTTENAKKLFL